MGIFKPSSAQNKILSGSILQLGKLGCLLYAEIHKEQKNIYKKTNENIKFYEDLFKSLNVPIPIKSRKQEKIVSPRFCALQNQIKSMRLSKNV